MSHETSFDRDTAERSPAASEAIAHGTGTGTASGTGRALALAMPLVLQGCGAPAPAHATTGVVTMASGSPMGAGPAASTGSASPGAAGGSAGGPGARAPQAPVVRISLGSYPLEREHEVASLLDYTNRSIGDDIQRLPGLVWYYSGIDRERHAIVNVSLWRDVPSAEQMSKLQAMLDLGAEMTRLGVQFVRPIPNFEPVWTFTGSAP